MGMLVQFVISLALLCSTPQLLAAQLVPQSAYAFSYFPHLVDGGDWQTTFIRAELNTGPTAPNTASVLRKPKSSSPTLCSPPRMTVRTTARSVLSAMGNSVC